MNILDFKLAPCFECHMFAFWLFHGICSLNTNVSEHSVHSIFIGHPFYTSLRKGDSQLRNNSFITTLHDSSSSPRNSTLTHAVYVSHCFQTCFLPATNPPEGLGYFSNLFPHYISPTLSLCTYSPMKTERTECSETLAFKLQTPGNNPKAYL
jgi:hypothetical protein